MNIQQCLEKMKEIHNLILEYIEKEDSIEENYQNLLQSFDDLKIREDQYKLNALFQIIAKISKNHNRGLNFFGKIEQILRLFFNEMKKYFSNYEIFKIFKSSKKVLLFLITEKIITINSTIVDKMLTNKYENRNYPTFFFKEIESFLDPKYAKSISKVLPDNYEELRAKGENEDYICELIRSDNIEEFIIYVKKNSISLDDEIKPSIFETNSFIVNKKFDKNSNEYWFTSRKDNSISLLEYTAFFGSSQIFKYILINSSKDISQLEQLPNFAVHGQNPEIIHQIEEKLNGITPYSKMSFIEAIKCHHNDVANYIQNNYLQENEMDSQSIFKQCLKYFNFMLMEDKIATKASLFDYCEYGYDCFVDVLLQNTNIDINQTKVF